MPRIDKVLEANQIQRDMKARFKKIFHAFDAEDYDNPKTKASIQEALANIHAELNRSFKMLRS